MAALYLGGIPATVFSSMAFLVTTGFGILAFIGRENLRYFAIGFLIPVALYSVSLISIGQSEFDPYDGKLPMTQIIRPVFDLVSKHEYIDMNNNLIPNYDPAAHKGPVGIRETPPDRTIFMSSAHILLALLLGFAGGKFALWIGHIQNRTAGNGG